MLRGAAVPDVCVPDYYSSWEWWCRAERIEMLLLLDDDVLEHLVSDGIVVLGGDTRSLVVTVDGTLLQLHGELKHLLDVGNLPGAERGIHVDVAFEKENPVGKLLDMPHLGNRNLAHDTRQIPVTGILEPGVEIHVLERRGDLLAHGVVQQVDADLVLGLDFGGFHKYEKGFATTLQNPFHVSD